MSSNRRERRSKSELIQWLLRLTGWAGALVLYYVVFSSLLDTPTEHSLRHSTDHLRDEYQHLSERYDSLTMVMESITERESNLFQIMFDSNPYDLESELLIERATNHEAILAKSTDNLRMQFSSELDSLEMVVSALVHSNNEMISKIEAKGGDSRRIPSIQPIYNERLTMLTASFGMRIHPFYKTLQPHNGVDYTAPEGTRIFATADGVVKSVVLANSILGKNMVIDHGNGYETVYTNMGRINIPAMRSVKRGDIIGLTGNTGLSITPHLHYEIRYNGVAVDPINYFFRELKPYDYQRIKDIAKSGMQSFD